MLVAAGLAASIERAQALIMAGQVRIGTEVIDKPGTMVALESVIEVSSGKSYVSRGGQKLAHALSEFAISVAGRSCADVGSSTGGFTDAMLQSGAAKVIAIDVGYGELDWRLRKDPRVTVLERTNVRYLEGLPFAVDFVSIDVSFISLQVILPVVKSWLTPGAEIIALIKPQFEAERGEVEDGGIVRNPEVHRGVLEKILAAAEKAGLSVRGVTRSPIQGTEGNTEFLAWLVCSEGESKSEFNWRAAVEELARRE